MRERIATLSILSLCEATPDLSNRDSLVLSSIGRYDNVNFGGAEVEGVDPNRSFFNLVDVQSLQFAP